MLVVLLDIFVLCGVITRFDIIGSVLRSLWDSGRSTVRLLDRRISLGGVITSLFQVEREMFPRIKMKTMQLQQREHSTQQREGTNRFED